MIFQASHENFRNTWEPAHDNRLTPILRKIRQIERFDPSAKQAITTPLILHRNEGEASPPATARRPASQGSRASAAPLAWGPAPKPPQYPRISAWQSPKKYARQPPPSGRPVEQGTFRAAAPLLPTLENKKSPPIMPRLNSQEFVALRT
jgi:hypothetical protein